MARRTAIFTESELKYIEAFRNGDRRDPNGTFSYRIRPKLLEIVEWSNMMDMIHDLLKPKSRKPRGTYKK